MKTFGRKISALVNGFGAGANVEPGDDPFASNEVLKVMAAARKRSAVPPRSTSTRTARTTTRAHVARAAVGGDHQFTRAVSKFPSKKTPVVDVVAEAPAAADAAVYAQAVAAVEAEAEAGGSGAQEPSLVPRPAGCRARARSGGGRARTGGGGGAGGERRD